LEQKPLSNLKVIFIIEIISIPTLKKDTPSSCF